MVDFLSLASLRKRYSPATDPSTTNKSIILAILIDIIAILIGTIAILIDIIAIFICTIAVHIDSIAILIYIIVILIDIKAIFNLILSIFMKDRQSRGGSSHEEKEDEEGVASHPVQITSP